MLAVVGTVPDCDFPLLEGKVTLENGDICIQGRRVPIKRGTPALLAAAVKVGEALDQEEPFGYLAGDIGRGDGSQKLYQYLVQHLKQTNFHTIAFHYLQPLVGWHKRVQSVIKKMIPKPILIADAGFMYVAKMSGQSEAYDLFTPDIGELAFLADEVAPHPFYTRGFILHEENHVPDLIARAYTHGNAARYILIKGRKDYVANKEGVQAIVDTPLEEAMEAIGGTGDTLTGIVAALSAAGMNIQEAAIVAARTNRLAGSYAHPTPATQVMEIIRCIPEALRAFMRRDPWKTRINSD
jgi:NAD(P)H-hydrate repair Nnr-like enzyme with NAD(P)H-hydrate dehydratase domain